MEERREGRRSKKIQIFEIRVSEKWWDGGTHQE